MLNTSDSEKRILLSVNIIILGFLLAVAFHYILGMYLGKGYPFNTFLFSPIDKFNDFFHPLRAASLKNPYDYYSLTGVIQPYLPLVYIIMKPLTLVPNYVAFGFVMLLFCLFQAFAIRFLVIRVIEKPSLQITSFLVLFACIYPFLFVLDRGSTESIIYIFIGLFFYFYYIRRSPIVSALFLGLSVSLKIIPGILIILYLADRDFRGFIWAAVFIFFINVFGFIYLSLISAVPIMQLVRDFLQQFSLYNQVYNFSGMGIGHRHTLWIFLQTLNLQFRVIDFGVLLKLYDGMILLLLGLIIYTVCMKKLSSWKRASLLLVSMVTLPSSLGDYTLIHLFYALMAFILLGDGNDIKKYLVLLSLVFIPITYVYIRITWVSDFLYPLILLSIIILLLREGFMEKGNYDLPETVRMKLQ